MPRQLFLRTLVLAAALGATTAHAHRVWLLPSTTVLSGNAAWVTVDGAVSNDIFIFEHQPLRLDNLVITAPDGTPVTPENKQTGKFRSVFDVPLAQQGTYRIAVANDGAFASWKVDGQQKRARGSIESLQRDIPANATDVTITQSQSRVESFVTRGKPTRETFKITGRGLEIDPVTHPNDLVAGETATFRMLLDGQPAADAEVQLVRAGGRYRDKLGERTLKTDADGKFAVKWEEPGWYWIEVELREQKTVQPPVKERRAAYVATFEVLPP